LHSHKIISLLGGDLGLIFVIGRKEKGKASIVTLSEKERKCLVIVINRSTFSFPSRKNVADTTSFFKVGWSNVFAERRF
jgi:hypothetical protein